MNNPLVSVCMITFNHGSFIKEAIQGVIMQQTDFDVELIISNDASTDKTHENILKTINKNNNLKINYIKHTENKGMMKNFIFSIGKCSGNYIALLDGDDYWTDPLKLQKQVDFLEKNNEYSMCFHEAEIVNKKNDFKSLFNNSKVNETFSLIDFTKRNFVSTASCMFRNNITLKESFKELSAADWALHLLNAENGKVYYIPDCMSAYRLHSEGVWSKLNHDEMILKGVEVMKELDRYFDYKYHDDFQVGIEKRLLRLKKKKELPTIKKKIIKKMKHILNKKKKI